MVSFNFLNFFSIFLEFSITGREGTEWKDNFYFLYFTGFSNLFFLEATMVFFNFLNFFLLFLNFLLHVGTERNGTKIFILSHSHPFPTYFRQKCCHVGIFLYFEFFGYFFEILYYALGRNETERKFLFLSVSSFSNLSWLEMYL